jgi:hypothetical protein
MALTGCFAEAQQAGHPVLHGLRMRFEVWSACGFIFF